jgi:hypothetical protein
MADKLKVFTKKILAVNGEEEINTTRFAERSPYFIAMTPIL